MRGLRRVGQLVIGEARAVSHRVGRPGAPIEVHQGEQHAGIDATAQQQADRHVADELTADGLLIEREQLLRCLVRGLRGGERRGLGAVPPAEATETVFDRQLCARGELSDPLEERVGRRGIAVAEEEIQRARIDLGRSRHRGTDGPDLRAEVQATAVDPVIDQLDAERIAREHEPPSSGVPDRKPEHAVEALEHLVAPLLVSVDDDLGVRPRAERVAESFQLAPQLQKIVDLAVEHHPDGLVLIGHGLMTAREIDDGEPPKAESDRPRHVVPLIVRAPVDEGPCHVFDVRAQDGSLDAEVVLSTDSAHGRGLSSGIQGDHRREPGVLGHLAGSREQETETPEHLRLRPAMHGDVVPAEEELATPERSVGLVPSHEEITDERRHALVQRRETAVQQDGQVEALRVVIQLSPIDREPRPPREGDRQALDVEEVGHVIVDPPFDGLRTAGRSGEPLDLRERLEDEARVEMVDEPAPTVGRIRPRAIGILRGKDEIQISIRRVEIPGVRQIDRGFAQEERPVGARVDDASRVVGGRRIRTGGGVRCRFDIPVLRQCVPGRGFHDPPPPTILVDPVDL